MTASRTRDRFELRRRSDDRVYRFARAERADGTIGYRREDADVWIVRDERFGWITVLGEHDERVAGLVWGVPAAEQGDFPPEGDWVGRKGDRSYVYTLVYTDTADAVEDRRVIDDPAAVTVDWLQRLLERRAPGANAGLRVASIECEPHEADNSRVVRLRVRYRRRPSPDDRWLERLVLKTCPAGHGFDSRSEIACYAEDYTDLADAPLVPFVGGGVDVEGDSEDASDDETAAGYFLVLGDLGERYRDNRLVRPTAAHARALGDALARLHAHRWNDGGAAREPSALRAAFERQLEHVRHGLEPLESFLGDALTAERRTWLRDAFGAAAERLRERLADGRGVTLLHGDPNPTNVLTPTAGEAHPPDGRLPLYLIDRQPFAWSVRIGLAALDLVHAAVPYWTPDERRALEPVLLDAYHAALRRAGITTYARADLAEDYRLCLVHAVHIGVEWGHDAADLHAMRWLWEAQIERAWCAMRDHGPPDAS